MSSQPLIQNPQSNWLRSYYGTRAAFSVVWVVAAFTIGRTFFPAAAVLLAVYPAWDAVANFFDARQNGGLGRNPSQAFNVAVSLATTIAVIFALTISMNVVLGVFGVWASLSGILQLVTGIRRWKTSGAQWAMALSGAQSTLAGGFFFVQTTSPATPSIADIAPYAAFGAFYFLVSTVQLSISGYRQRRDA